MYVHIKLNTLHIFIMSLKKALKKKNTNKKKNISLIYICICQTHDHVVSLNIFFSVRDEIVQISI